MQSSNICSKINKLMNKMINTEKLEEFSKN